MLFLLRQRVIEATSIKEYLNGYANLFVKHNCFLGLIEFGSKCCHDCGQGSMKKIMQKLLIIPALT